MASIVEKEKPKIDIQNKLHLSPCELMSDLNNLNDEFLNNS